MGEVERTEEYKIKINNKKMQSLLYLPVYAMPRADEYCAKLLSAILGSKSSTKLENVPMENLTDKMEVDSDSDTEKSGSLATNVDNFEIDKELVNRMKAENWIPDDVESLEFSES